MHLNCRKRCRGHNMLLSTGWCLPCTHSAGALW